MHPLLRFARIWLLLQITVVVASAPPPTGTRLLLRFRPEVQASLPAGTVTAQLAGLETRLGLPEGARLEETPVARLFRRDDAKAGLDLNRFLYLRLPPVSDPAGLLERLENHPLLLYAERDGVNTAALDTPVDPAPSRPWHHRNPVKPSASIQTPSAWEITRGSSNVLVAVLDSGVAPLPEFAGRVVPGYNFAEENADTTDNNGHGTRVTAMIAAVGADDLAVSGVDWRCRVMPVKVLDLDNRGQFSWQAQGIDFAVGQGCKVINFSIASDTFNRTLQNAINNAIARGVIFVTAAGNNGADQLSFPGYLSQCITVGSTDREDRRAFQSNSGPQLDLVSPGQGVFTLGRSGELEQAQGTSFAAPLVSGVCALLASVRPSLTQADARQLLCSGAEDQVGDPKEDAPGFDSHYGWGRLNAFHSLLLATAKLDGIRATESGVELAWVSPSNAPARRPFVLESKDSADGKWEIRGSEGEIRYEKDRATWTDTRPREKERWYRLRLRSF